MSADTCCCGKVEIYSDCVSAIFNDYEHERYGEGRFCGPRWKHEVRDARLAAMKAESDLARLRRRVRILESRLAKVLRLAEGTGLTMLWTEHNGGGTVWSWRHQRCGTHGNAGRVWSKHRRAK